MSDLLNPPDVRAYERLDAVRGAVIAPRHREPAPNVACRLNAFVDATAGINEAVLVSPDGVPVAASSGLDRVAAAQLATAAASIVGLGRALAGRFCAGAVTDVSVGMEHAAVMVTGVADRPLLLVAITDSDASAEVLAGEVATVVDQLGPLL